MNASTQFRSTHFRLSSPLTLLAVACPVVAGLALPALAANYTFTNIADTGGPFDSFGFLPSINTAGTVAFDATLDAGGEGIFIGSGGPTTTIIDNSGQFSFFRPPTINSGGTVAFGAALDAGGEGIFTGSGGPTTTIADDSGQFAGFDTLSINSAGTVAFWARLDTPNDGIFTGSGGSTTTIADRSGLFSQLLPVPSINTGGTVAFFATLDGGGNGIFTGSGGPTAAIADDSGPFDLFNESPSINTGGTVAFGATLDAGGQGIFTGSGGLTATIADDSGPFRGFDWPSINTAGTVAFYATLDAGGHGVFTGDDAVGDKVIRTGEPLFGSTVTDVGFARGLNDNGDIAFYYQLANGTRGIAVARIIPEPASPTLLLAGLIAMFLHRPAVTPKHRRLVGVAIVKTLLISRGKSPDEASPTFE